MTKTKDNVTIDDLVVRLKTYIEDEEEINEIIKAHDFAKKMHANQYRKSGEAYIIHPINVAIILTSIYADGDTIKAALLHDVLEDTECSDEQMEELFGKEVTKLVQGVTKLSKIHFSTELLIF